MSTAKIVSIVDDDESVRLAAACLLRSLGYDAYPFPSAEDFLYSPLLKDTDCLIADVQMPGMSGLELQEVLAARGSRIPIIFITAFPRDSVRDRVVAAGAVAFLEKPFDAENIIKYVNCALGQER